MAKRLAYCSVLFNDYAVHILCLLKFYKGLDFSEYHVSMHLNLKSILVVEDDEDIREILREVIELEGAEVEVAENGEQALKVWSQLPKCDVILVDLMMPVMGGDTFIKTLKESGATTPIVLMSADFNVAEVGIECMVDAVIKKPVDIDHLIEKLKDAIQSV